MAFATPRPEEVTVVIVQGSFQRPLNFPAVATQRIPHSPSKTLLDDTNGVRRVIQKLVQDVDKTVIFVMHSYGGLVGSNAIDEELSFSHRRSSGLAGGVLHLFYFAAFVLDEEQSVLGAFGESPNNDVREDGRFYMKEGASLLYNDLPSNEASEWESRMIPQSNAVKKTKIERTAYRYISSTYLICEGDKAVAPQYQEMFAKAAGAIVVRCNVGHSPMLSQVEMLVDKIEAAIRAALAEIK